jgi:hypothetical protein
MGTETSDSELTLLDYLVEKLAKRVIALGTRRKWPTPLIDAALRYGMTLIVGYPGVPNPIQQAESAMTELAVAYLGAEGRVVVEMVNKRYTDVCYKYRELIGSKKLPGMSQKWYRGLYERSEYDADTYRQQHPQESPSQ